eukprot:Mrub_09096.p3 GENE.Mrub_09096~~Mrub_09096.p3  ORF type:complete len:116 (-),score=4.48 Mrub_09096:176-523(-)
MNNIIRPHLSSRLERSIRVNIDTIVPAILENKITYRPIRMSKDIPIIVRGESFVYVKADPVILAATYSKPAYIVQPSNKDNNIPRIKEINNRNNGMISTTHTRNDLISLDIFGLL